MNTTQLPPSRGPLLIRILSFFLAIVFALGIFRMYAVKAHAAVVGTSAVAIGTAATQVYFPAVGVSWTVITGGSSAGAAAVATVAESYAAATGVASSGSALLSTIGAGVSISPAGVIILSAAAALILAGFVAWCVTEYVPDVSSSSTIVNGSSLLLSDGTRFRCGTANSDGSALLSVGDCLTASIYVENGVVSYDCYPAPGDTITFANSGIACKWSEEDLARKWATLKSNYGIADGSLTGTAFNGYISTGGFYFMTIAYVSSAAKWYGFNASSKTSSDIPDASTFTKNTAFCFSASDGDAVDENVELGNIGYTPAPSVSESDNLQLITSFIPAGTTVEQLPQVVDDVIDAGDDIEVMASAISPTLSVDFDAAYVDESGNPQEPEDPGTGTFYLPSLPIPWHYVTTMMSYAGSFITTIGVVISTLLPTSLQATLWAAVVLALLFALLRRFLT